eukprot:jgi/Orpsp1_1/1188014/evm.model.d7180000061822.1
MYGMTFGDANPFTYGMDTGRNTWSTEFNLELGLNKSKSFKVGDYEYGNENAWKVYKKNLADNFVVPEIELWKKDSFKLKDGKYTLQRASFTPEGAATDGVKNPLVIWLHGGGEGGNDIDIALLGNEVLALARKPIQKYFITEKQKGAYVLALQTPTLWMDNGSGKLNSEIEGERQKSMYDEVLFAAIQDYVNSNPDIDTDRIYVGGCSNGGYMTMDLIFEHGDYFAAYYPICEYYMDRNISDEMIDQAKDYNIWFLHSEDDTTVDPFSTSIPSYYRLINAGAKNVHYTLTDKVRGTDDPNATYIGHYSWIYAFNDQVKKEFDNAKVKADFENISIEGGKLVSTNNYVTNANCNKEGNMWTWLSEQTKTAKEEEAEETSKGAVNAQMVVMGYEWGPAVPKVIVEFDDEVSGFSKNTFTVKTGNTKRVILDVYNSDKDGKKQENATKYLTFEFKVNTVEMYGMANGEANPFSYDMTTGRNTWAKTYELELDLSKSESFKVGNYEYNDKNAFKTFKVNLAENYIVPETAVWKKDSFKLKDGKYTLQRASFSPEGAAEDGVKNPLIIWLHGAGEGGVDVDITLLGNEV